MPIIGPTYFKFRDFPGAREVADLLKKVREKQFPGLDGDDKNPMDPEAMKAQMEGMGQQMQQMQQALQMATQKIETEQAKQQATMMKAQLDAQSAMQKAQLDSDTKLRISAADNETKLALAGMESKLEALLTLLKLEHEGKKIDAENARTEMAEAKQDQRTGQQQVHEVAMNQLNQEAPEAPEPPEAD
jgi:hypothetical protein